MNGICRACGILGLLVLWLIHSLNAQGAVKRVTAATTKGELVEGILKGATDTTITVEVAGQPIQIPIDTLQYLSFIGPLATRIEKSPATSSPMEDAFAAVAELKSAAEVGVLRAQWADRMLAAVPRVRAFTRSSDAEWPDVKAALEMAVDKYGSAINNWQYGSIYFDRAARAADYAKDLAAKPEERNHKETPAPERQLSFGTPAIGRLGFGDATLAGRGYSETFALSVTEKTNVVLDLDCVPGDCMVIVVGSDGKAIDDRDYDARKFKKSLAPGIYKVQVTTGGPREVGIYKLTASVLK